MINRPAQNIVSLAGRFLIGLICLALLLSLSIEGRVYAVDYPKLTNRVLTVEDVSPGATTNYTMSWQYPANTFIGSIRFEFCDNGFYDEPCVNPGGDLSSATLTSQSGITGFSILNQSTDHILMARAPAAANTTPSTYVFDAVVNPATVQSSFYIRISTYPSGDGTGAFNHFSSVASAITSPILINTEIPPILYFCAALFVTDYCQSIGGNQIDYGTLSSFVEDAAVSQFGAATNAVGGYVVTIRGSTMTAGIRTIPALAVPTPNVPGTAQFGLNLRANTNPAIGQDMFGPGIGFVDGDYNTPDQFKFEDGDVVATAFTGTLFNTYTVTYIVNVPPTQEAGIYNTTIAYICTAAF